jgi:multidrug resistance efflux pump
VVKAGEPVVAFDTTELQQRLRQKLGERDAAATELEKRRNELAIERQDQELELAEVRARLRRSELKLEVPASLVSRQELEASRVERALAVAEVASLERSLGLLARRTHAELAALRDKRNRAAQRVAELRRDIAAMDVEAPRAGTVIYATSEEGEKSKVGDSAWRAQTILEIPDLHRMVAEGEVDEADMGRLSAGQRVSFRLDAHPDLVFHGAVRSVRKSVQPRSPSDPSRVARVEIALARIDPERMRPGMRFRGSVEVERVHGTLCLPLEAVDPRPGGPVVTVVGGLANGEVTPRLGRRDAKCVEVLAGLAAGDRVLVAGEGSP